MRNIHIDTENASAVNAGRIGEHNATTITFTVPAELAAAADYYRAAIEVNGEVHYTGQIEKATPIFKLESEHTAAETASFTIEGYKNAGNFVGKSAKISLCFGPAAGGTEPAENTGTLAGLVDAAVAEAIDQLSFVAETYQSAEDLPADAATGTLAIIDPTPEWDRAPVQIFKGQFLRRIFINGDPPDPREVLPEDRPNTRGVIVENTDGETARMVLYFEAAKENDFLGGKPGIVVLWNFDENGDPAAVSLYNTEPNEIEGEFCAAGWHIANFETGGIEPREFDEIDFPAFDFEPRMIFNPDGLPQVVPLGYSIATQASFDNRGLGYYMSVDPYKSKKIYHKKEAGWEEVT